MRRRYAAVALLLALIALFWLLGARSSGVDTADPPAAPAPPARAASTRKPHLAEARSRPPAPPAETPILVAVDVEKRSVCQHQVNLVTVRATTASGNEADLRYFVGGEEGRVVAVRRTVEQADSPIEVIVYGRDGLAVRGVVPRYEIRPCIESDQLLVYRGFLSPSVVKFEARLTYLQPPMPITDEPPTPRTESNRRPVRYRWSFGDGASAETTAPAVTHDYGRRAQTTRYTSLLVSCEAVEQNGDRLLGHTSLQLTNPDFISLADEGVIRLNVEVGEGTTTRALRLWHRRKEPVTLTEVRVRRLTRAELETARQPDDLEPEPETLTATRVFDSTTVPPAGVDGRIPIQGAAVELLIEGRAGDFPAHGEVVVTAPELPPVLSRLAVDRGFRARLLRARQHLDRDDVSEAEVERLRGEPGLFDDVDDQGPPPAPLRPEEARRRR